MGHVKETFAISRESHVRFELLIPLHASSMSPRDLQLRKFLAIFIKILRIKIFSSCFVSFLGTTKKRWLSAVTWRKKVYKVPQEKQHFICLILFKKVKETRGNFDRAIVVQWEKTLLKVVNVVLV